MILLDTSVLVHHLASPGASSGGPLLEVLLMEPEAVRVPTLVLYEWWRGPRQAAELDLQRRMFPDTQAVPFGVPEARVAAELHESLPRARRRGADIAIAACALVRGAWLWTLNEKDFRDVPGLLLYGGNGSNGVPR